MKPSVGRIVHYWLNEQDALEINRRRVAGAGHGKGWPAGAQAHVGNAANHGEHVPMIVTIAWPENNVNGQVFLDGNDSLWRTSVKEGSTPGTWHWPERVEE